MDASVSNHRVIMEYLQIPSENDSQISQSNDPTSKDKHLYCLIIEDNLESMTKKMLEEVHTLVTSYKQKDIGESVVPEPDDAVTMTAPADVRMTSPADVTTTATDDAVTMTAPADVTMTALADVTMTALADVRMTSSADVSTTATDDAVTMTALADVRMTSSADVSTTATDDTVTMTAPADATMTSPADVTMTAPADATMTAPADATMTSPADVTMTAPADATMTELADVTMTALAVAVTKTESVTGQISTDNYCQQLVIAPENIEVTDNSQLESNGKIYGNASVEKIFEDYTKFILKDNDNEGYTSNSRGDALSFGLQYLAPALKDTSVTSLNLGWCGLSGPTIIHFAKNLHSSNLKKLILCANDVQEYDERVFQNAFKDSGIEWLDVEADPICDPLSSYDDYDGPPSELDMDYLDQCQNNPERTTLYVQYKKQILENGPYFLSPILKSSYIENLHMGGNSLSCDHMKLFAPSLMETKLTHLDLGHNKLGYEGIKYLASALKNTRITHLNLQFNSLTCNTLKNLVFALPETKITDLNLSGNDICCNAFYLACVLKNTQISDLDLMSCDITKTSYLKHLIKNCFQISSEDNEINVSGYNLCSVILYNISWKIKETNIRDLKLSHIGINNDDLEYLCHGLVGSKVKLLDLSKNNMNCKSVQILCGVLEHTHISHLDLAQNRISCDGIKHLAQVLPRTRISKLNLAENGITCIGVKHLFKHLTQIVDLTLSNNGIDCGGAQHLAEALRQSQITKLELYKNKIGFPGLKCITDCLRDSQLTYLDVSNNPLTADDIEYLASNLENTKILKLNLRGLKISRKTAYRICETVVSCSRKYSANIYMDSADDDFIDEIIAPPVVYEPPWLETREDILREDPFAYEYDDEEYWPTVEESVAQNEPASKKDNELQLENDILLFRFPGYTLENTVTKKRNRIDHFIKNVCNGSQITKIIVDSSLMEDYGILSGAFDGINISELSLFNSSNLDDNFLQLFRNSNIAEFMFSYQQYFVDDDLNFLAKSAHLKVISLKLGNIKNPHLSSLKSALLSSSMRYLNLSDNKLGDDEFDMLTQTLTNSRIISLNLCGNNLGTRSVDLLADVLPSTKITFIDLSRNNLCYSELECLTRVAEKTDVCWIELSDNHIESAELPAGVSLSPYIVPRNETPHVFQMRYDFKRIVALNAVGGELEFVLPRTDEISFTSLSCYPRLVKSLMETPDSNIHLYDVFYMETKRHDIGVMNAINRFMKEISQRFMEFFDRCIIELGKLFSCDCFIDLVKACDELQLIDCVEHILLHRALFYVDTEQNTLHPFIYRMLHKCGMPLYNESLEPNKRQQIVDYFSKHAQIDGAQELIDLLSDKEVSCKRMRHV
ncbi:uncharacterized protein LOC111058109 isoform X2 [Nilaparvata lugens]|uniref:uncharacterized protein LOC111058109 isoform X2 n=1 Tax=Nilaparvata lugens TaxID=108931 RepID=UPI00193D2DF0|nr:uncharacterized protein LOC111058109 isoform X2 [Nilaparvata lugens]